MGDRYIITVKCQCGFIDDDVYYAPTCGFLTWKCPKCGEVTDLEKETGISYEDASNVDLINSIIDQNEKLPESIWHGQINIAGMTLNVHVLDNGQRVIEAEDVRRFFDGLADAPLKENETMELAKFIRGSGIPCPSP